MNKKKNYNILSFFESFFKFITLFFWFLMWYKWIVISIKNYEYFLFIFFIALSTIYIFSYLIAYIFSKNKSEFNFLYKIITVITFCFSLTSFLLYPISIPLIYAKLMLIILLFIISYRLTKYKNNNEGVVGILTSFLIAAFTYFY